MRKHILILTAIVVVISAALVAFFLKVNLYPVKAASEAYIVDNLFTQLLVVASVIFALCLVTIVYSCIVFRRRRGDTEDGPSWHEHGPIETMWTIIPLAIVMVFAVIGAMVLRDITQPPATAKELEVKVVGAQWAWRFEYPEYGVSSSELRLPVDRPVLFRLHATDVIHSLWVPEFRLKEDAVPGIEVLLRITPDRVGDYKVLCAELCGLAHSYMIAPARVVEPASFDQWVRELKR